jgi:hypothetical protein
MDMGVMSIRTRRSTKEIGRRISSMDMALSYGRMVPSTEASITWGLSTDLGSSNGQMEAPTADSSRITTSLEPVRTPGRTTARTQDSGSRT